jgi:hypothetical protein
MAGPALIVAAVVVTLRAFAFQGLITNEHPDILSFWLPRWSFLGRSLAAGQLPLWNPYEMLGSRFAADPQSGWTYLPPMLLFSTLRAGVAMAMMIVLHPTLAGLGLYAFLRSEGIVRAAATVGGLGIAMLIAGSELAISMPFSGFLAWTAVSLACLSRMRRADRWSRRLTWLAGTALAWSQVANAHMSHGLAMCTLLVLAYLTTHAVAAVRRDEIRASAAVGRTLLVLVVLPVAAAAVILPRLSLLRDSSLAGGYDRLGAEIRGVAGIDERPIQANGVWAGWPLGFAAAPGAFAGAAALLCVPLAFRSRRQRPLAVAFAGSLLLVWVLMLNGVVTAPGFRDLMDRIPFGDTYIHNPGRLRHLAVIALPTLAAVGLHGMIERPLRLRVAALWIVGGAMVFAGLPLLAGGRLAAYLVVLAALPVAAAAFAAAASGRRWGPPVLAGVLAVELLVAAAIGAARPGVGFRTGLEGGVHPNLVLQPLRRPRLSTEEFLTPTPLVPLIGDDRYFTWAPPASFYEKGYLFAQGRDDWPALAMERGTLFGLRDVLGYNPVQLARYWTYIRATNELDIFYNTSVIQLPSRQDALLTATRYLVVPEGVFGLDPPLPGRVVATEQGYDLVEITGWQSLVSVVPDWRVVDSTAAALRPLLEPDFDPSRTAILEEDPGIRPRPGAAIVSARWRSGDARHLIVTVEPEAPSILLVRNSYDEGWRATVDGEPRRIFATDGFLQGVALEPGDRLVELTYHDRAVAAGLGISAGAWIMLASGIAAASAIERAGRRDLFKQRPWPLGVPGSTEPIPPEDPAGSQPRTGPPPAGAAPGTR